MPLVVLILIVFAIFLLPAFAVLLYHTHKHKKKMQAIRDRFDPTAYIDDYEFLFPHLHDTINDKRKKN